MSSISRISSVLAALLVLAAIAVPAASASVPSDFFGIEAVSPTNDDFKGMDKAGFGTYRAPVNWGSVQSSRNGDYDWAQPDSEVYYAAKNGIRPTLMIYGTPRFVHKGSDSGLYGPTSKQDLNEWQKFTKAVAERYGTHGYYFDATPGVEDLPVKTWIVWNEQNAKTNWLPKANPREYAKAVEAADKGISKVDPEAKIVLGGMYGYPKDAASMKAATFLAKFYKEHGIAKHFDAVNSHPYGPDVNSVKAQVSDLRDVMRKAGDSGAGLLVGEMGWASSGPSKSEAVVGKQGQAQRLSDALKMLVKKRNSWNIEGAFVYAWRDFDGPSAGYTCLWCPGAGLVKQNGKPKPALNAVKKVIR